MTYLVRTNPHDQPARDLKAACFRHLGFAQLNVNWRNWYLTSARELDGSLDEEALQRRFRGAMSSTDLIAALPIGRVIEGLSVRLDADLLLSSNFAVSFEVADVGEEHVLEIRRGVAQFHAGGGPAVQVTIKGARSALLRLLMGQYSLDEALAAGEISLTGDGDAAAKLFGAIEEVQPIALTVR